ncbi:LIM domain only protein 3 [Aphelenchoides fujianensis]|nr:LIM domain only protein 3 [Aphelenchoides fujianensis]
MENVECAGCGLKIRDQFALEVIGRKFHDSCLKCACCNGLLADLSRICYHRNSLLLCQRDYMRLFGTSGVCARCFRAVPPLEYVMRAKNHVFHLNCFSCARCNGRFCVGDYFFLVGSAVYCPADYNYLLFLVEQQRAAAFEETNKSARSEPPAPAISTPSEQAKHS